MPAIHYATECVLQCIALQACTKWTDKYLQYMDFDVSMWKRFQISDVYNFSVDFGSHDIYS
jgi:hypothetical protein